MPTDVVMPQMGESIFEGTITKWLKKVGDAVQRDEPLFEISTDKVDAEIPSPVAGTLTEIKCAEGETVQINTVVAVIDGAAPKSKSAPKAQTLPLIPSPFTSPPMIGMIRRTPVPISPADVTSPIRAVMVKTYLVSSFGVVIGHLCSVVTMPQVPHGEEREARLEPSGTVACILRDARSAGSSG